MARPLGLLLLLGLHGAHGQMSDTDVLCEQQLVSQSPAFNAACCPTADVCSGGFPSSCPDACAAAFMPFYSTCASFVATNLPDLVAFGAACTAAGVAVTPLPPPIGGAPSPLECSCRWWPHR